MTTGRQYMARVEKQFETDLRRELEFLEETEPSVHPDDNPPRRRIRFFPKGCMGDTDLLDHQEGELSLKINNIAEAVQDVASRHGLEVRRNRSKQELAYVVLPDYTKI